MAIKQNKKAAITQAAIVSIIILVVSLAIIIPLYTTFNSKSTFDKEACRSSVYFRANEILKGTHITGELYPLKCKTEEIKISSSNDEIIKKEVATAMYECWWMMGQGKVDFFSPTSWWDIKSPFGTEKATCIVCSTIEFEKGAKNKQINIVKYLGEQKVPLNEITYLEYLSNNEGTKLPANLELKPIDTNKNYMVVFTGMKGTSYGDLGKISGSAILVSTATGGAIGSVIPGVGTLVGMGIGFLSGLVSSVFVSSANVATNIHASSIHCDGALGGCFAISLVESGTTDLTKTCQKIESIP